MEIDPIVVALSGAITGIAGLFYRHLMQERERCEANCEEWERRYWAKVALTDLALDEPKANR